MSADDPNGPVEGDDGMGTDADAGTDDGTGHDDSYVGAAVALVGIAAVLLVVGYAFVAGGGGGDASSDGATAIGEAWPGVAAGDGPHPTLVSANASGDAPVTVTYYGDFQCPHCRAFEADNLPKLRRDYVAPGHVRLVFNPVNLRADAGWTRNSRSAALGSHCVWRHNRSAYWRWHAAVFRSQGEASTDWATPSTLGELANDAGLDGDLVRGCVADASPEEAYDAIQREFRRREIGSTPGFVVEAGNDTTVVVGNDYDALTDAIEAHLGEGRGGDEPDPITGARA